MTAPRIQSLSGPWRAIDLGSAAEVIDGAAATFEPEDAHTLAAVHIDDDHWPELTVPGHWRSHSGFADSDGPILLRRHFRTAPIGAAERMFLVLHGVMAAGDVWFDGTYLGDIRSYAVPHTFEITGLLTQPPDPVEQESEHVVAIEAGFEPVGTGRIRDLSGAFGRSALIGTGHNPGGVWRDVELRTTGPVRLDHCRLRCTDATAERAVLAVRVVLDSEHSGPAIIRTWVRRVEDQLSLLQPGDGASIVIDHPHTLAVGENRSELEIEIPDPALWWPRSLGDQPLYDVGIEVVIDGVISDTQSWRTGLRTVVFDDFIAVINGQRMFLKGISLGPTRLQIADASPAEVAADIALVAEAGLDLVRVHGHMARAELYEAADRLGILIWQDLPIQWALLRQTKPAARRVARWMVDQLAHHPSILLWNAHHEPWAGEPSAWRDGDASRRLAMRLRMLTAQLLPSWNRTLLDRSVADTLASSDPSRPVLAQSGSWPHLPRLAGGASHLWIGWRWGRTHDLVRLLRWWPALGRFVAEFGAQAPGPAPDQFIDGTGIDWPGLDWPDLARRSALELPALMDQVPPDRFASPGEWVAAMQGHQRELLVNHVETLRRLKYRPTGGFAAFALADSTPGITAALLDQDRRPKPAWPAFVAVCAPVIAVLEAPPVELRTDDRLALAVHVVNDLRSAIEDLTVTVTLRWLSDPDRVLHRAGWTGRVGPDEVTRVGVLRVTVPEPPGAVDTLVVEVQLRGSTIDPYDRVHHRLVPR
jgi:beta-mannosidase